jgi:hypothetical protein
LASADTVACAKTRITTNAVHFKVCFTIAQGKHMIVFIERILSW